MRSPLAHVGIAVTALLLWMTAAAHAARPNILLLFMDNVGYGDLGCYGNKAIKTPHIDALARESVRCTQFYIGSPSCTPSRGALLTGRHPERNGLNWQLKAEESFAVGLPAREKLIPQYLKPLGYATGCFGKWNIGFGEGVRPTERGFDEFLGHASGNINYYTYQYETWNDLRRGTEPFDARGRYATDLFADAAIDFIHRHRGRPWFVYLPFNAPHFPMTHNFGPSETLQWQVPPAYLAMYGSGPDEKSEQIRFYAVMSALDAAIGRVLAALDDTAQRDNTLVVLLSDNGAFMLPGRGKEVQTNRPLRDGGVTVWEGGIRVPCLIRWPDRLPAGRDAHAMLWSMDLLPMFLAAAGAPLPTDITLDGRDPTAALAGGPSPHHEMGWVWTAHRAYRRGDYKIVQPAPPKRNGPAQPWELFDLSADPAETTNLAAKLPEKLTELQRGFEAWHTAVKRP